MDLIHSFSYLKGRSLSHVREEHSSVGADALRGARSSPMIARNARSPISVQVPLSPSAGAGSLEWLWYSPSSVLEQHHSPSRLSSPQLREDHPNYYHPYESEASPSPPRIPLRPHRVGRSSLKARSTPLITTNLRCGGSHFLSPRSCALDRFVDLQMEDRTVFSPLVGSTPTLVSRPPTPMLLLRRSISPRVRGRLSSLTSQKQVQTSSGGVAADLIVREYSNSCVDVMMPTRQALLPTRATAHRAASDMARMRFRKKLAESQEQQRQQQNDDDGA